VGSTNVRKKRSLVGWSRGVVGEARAVWRGLLPWIILALLSLGPLLVCALIGPVGVGTSLGQKAAPDWSRALSVGGEFYGTDSGAPLVVDDQGRVHLVWALRFEAHKYDLRYLRLDQQGLVEDQHDLNLSLFEPRRVRLLSGSDGLMHIFLLASPEEGAPSGLFQLTLTDTGQLSTAPSLLSSETNQCFEYAVAADSSGPIHVFWTEGAGAERDLYYLELGPDGQAELPPKTVARGVSGPVAAMGPDEVLHVFWEQPGANEDTANLHHAAVEGTMPGTLSGPKLLDLPTGSRFFRTGPVVAFDAGYAYLVWTVEYRRDMAAPAISEGWYGSFPLVSPSLISARPFYLPMDESPSYETHDSPLKYRYLAPSTGEAELGSERVTSPFALSGHAEAIVSCGMTMMRGVSLEHQIVNLIFDDGELLGYQVAGNTTHWSRLSSLVADAQGNLHLSWVDGLEPGPSAVYYATTAQTVRERVDRLTRDDLVSAALNTAFSTVAGASAVPLAVFWVLPPIIWALVVGCFTGQQGTRGARWYAALVIAVVIYQVSKLYFSPGLMNYEPLSASVPFMPTAVLALLSVLAPLGIVGLATLGAFLALARTGTSNLLAITLVFVLTDAFLTLLAYGPGLALLA
jgi:hypothetical protein